MLERLDLAGLPADSLGDHLPRPEVGGEEPLAAVREIISEVRSRGDDALREYAERFDGSAPDVFRVATTELDAAIERLTSDLVDALQFAHDSIEAFHRTQLHGPQSHVYSGMLVEGLQLPVERAGCYVPGGRAAYPSTVLMTAVPAKVAGVEEVCLCVPPTGDGRVADVTLAAARIAGVDEVYAIGGAQAIAAMAYGTESIAGVDVIAGPGNVYVAVAKREVAGDVGVAAAFAGPSEIVVVADATVPVSYAAIDLVVQAEHGPGGLAWLITTDSGVADSVTTEVCRLASESPRRSDIEATLAAGGYAVVVDDAEAAMVVANAIAPEHLQLMVAEPRALLPLVRNAGAVFCGPYSPASVGDYVAGPSHVLPTNGTARFAGALTVQDFCKDIHVITLDQDALERVAPAVAAIADAEGLAAHADSVRVRQGTEETNG
ncbi:MAG: histidinol dehydrogenase [Acidimicrobiales bacterium]